MMADRLPTRPVADIPGKSKQLFQSSPARGPGQWV